MQDDDEWEQPSAYGRLLGRRIRAIRRQKGLSLQDVEAQSDYEFKASALGAYERGERAISVPRLQRLARFYHVPVDQMLPAEEALTTVGESMLSAMRQRRGSVTIDLVRARDIDGAEGTMLNRYLEMIQVERQDFNGKMLTIRHDDLRAIACIFHTTSEQITDVLEDMGLIYSS
jgi:transcriptional regulator with XRE-family HTH domain